MYPGRILKSGMLASWDDDDDDGFLLVTLLVNVVELSCERNRNKEMKTKRVKKKNLGINGLMELSFMGNIASA